MDAKKLKLIVRGDKKPTFGTDPNEPWSVRAGITESERGELHAYLKSRGINPDFVSKDTKISHAKSSEFHKWRRDHQFDDPINFVSTTAADKMKQQRAQTEEVEQMNELAPETLASYVLKTTSKDPKRAEPRKKAMSKLAKIMAKRSFSEEKKPTALEKFRAAAAEREKKHDEIRKKQSKDGSGMTAAIDRLAKHLNKEEIINEVSKSEVEHHFNNWSNSEHAPYNSDAGDDNKVHQSALSYLRSTNVPKEKHEKLAMHIAHKFHGSGIDEEVKQIDELKMSTVKSYHKKRLTDFSYANKKPGETSTKPRNARIKKVSAGIDRSIDRQTGYKPTSEETEQIDEKNVPTSPEKWARAKAAAKSKFAVYPSAYANGWASKKYKAMGGGWKSVKEESEQVNEMDTYPHPDSKEGKALTKAFKSSAKKDPTDLNAPGKSPTVKQTTSALLPMLNKSFKKAMNREEVELTEISKSEVEHHFHQWTNSEHAPYNSDAGDDNKVHQSALSYLRSTNVPKEKHEKLAMHIAHKFHGSGIDEEVEQIDELKKSTVFSWLKQQPVVPEKKPGMTRKDHNKKIKSHSKSWNRALDRLAGYKPTSEETEDVSEVFSTGVQGHVSQAALDSIKNKRNVKVNLGTPSYNPKPKTLAKNPSKKASFISRLLNKEDTYQDSYAATQTTGMEIVDLPADEKYNKRKEMSKSARMIKSLYKKKGMKEGVDGQSGGGIMYDKEKTDKLETPYGKKPSMVRADKKLTISDKEPQAAAVLTGGKTLTGQDRDTLEIDPLMRKPGPPLDQNKKT